MECDSVHSTIENQYKHVDVYLPSQFVVHSITARKLPIPYRAKLLNYSFFKNYSQNMIYSSIRPERSSGDPTITDLRMLQYEPNGIIYYKLNFDYELKELPGRPNNKCEQYLHFQTCTLQKLKYPLTDGMIYSF